MDEDQATAGGFTRVLIERIGRGKNARAIRRVFPFDRQSHCLIELQTAYLDLEYGLESLNSQIAVLADLNFFALWVELRKRADPNWVTPEHRAARNLMPLTLKEIKDFGRWCQRKCSSLVREITDHTHKVRWISGADVVSVGFRNRRLRNASLHVQWLITMLADIEEASDSDLTLVESRRRQTERWFDKQLLPDLKALPVRSLHPSEARDLQLALSDEEAFPNTAIGTRDRLVVELLYQGVRAGELLKIQCADVDAAYELDLGRKIGVVSIERRPNDVEDERVHEPAVKTRPGTLPIPKRLARALVDYVIDHRRVAIDARNIGHETSYLFVNHFGRFTGHPLSQRNLNRLIAKLKGRFGLPENIHPHALRHTHLTELYDQGRKNGKSDLDIRDLLVDRGRWAPDSMMPRRYTGRSLMREAADFVEERDERMQRA